MVSLLRLGSFRIFGLWAWGRLGSFRIFWFVGVGPPLPWGLNIAVARLWRAFYLMGRGNLIDYLGCIYYIGVWLRRKMTIDE